MEPDGPATFAVHGGFPQRPSSFGQFPPRASTVGAKPGRASIMMNQAPLQAPPPEAAPGDDDDDESLPSEDKVEMLENLQSCCPLLSSMNIEELEYLTKYISVQYLKDGEVIITPGVKATFIGIVYYGFITVGNPRLMNNEWHKKDVQIQLKQGELLGEPDFMLKKETLPYKVVAWKKSIILTIPFKIFSVLHEHMPALGLKLWMLIARSGSEQLQKLYIKGCGEEVFDDHQTSSVVLQEMKPDLIIEAQEQYKCLAPTMSRREIREVADYIYLAIFKAGEPILRSGQRATAVLLLLRGSVESYTEGGTLLGYKNPGELVGEEGFVASLHDKGFTYTRFCNVYAHSDCSLGVLTQEALDKLSEQNISLSYRLQRNFASIAIRGLQRAAKTNRKLHFASDKGKSVENFGSTRPKRDDDDDDDDDNALMEDASSSQPACSKDDKQDLTQRTSYFKPGGGSTLPVVANEEEGEEEPAASPREDLEAGAPDDSPDDPAEPESKPTESLLASIKKVAQKRDTEESDGTASTKMLSMVAKNKLKSKLKSKSQSSKVKGKKSKKSKKGGRASADEEEEEEDGGPANEGADMRRLRKGSLITLDSHENENWSRNDAFELLMQAMGSNPIFSSFESGEVRLLSRQMSLARLKVGEKVMYEGEFASFFCLMLGSGAIVKSSGKLLRELPAGSLVGELALFVSGKRHSDIVAAGDCSVAIFVYDHLEEFTESMPELGMKMLRSLAYSGLVHMKQATRGDSEYTRFRQQLEENTTANQTEEDHFTYADNPLVMMMMEAFRLVVRRRVTMRELHVMKNILRFAKFKKGDCVLRKGQISTCALIVLEGKLMSYVDDRDSKRIGITAVGDFVGETAIMQDERSPPMLRRANTYVSSKTAVVAVVTFERLVDLNSKFPALARELFAAMSEMHFTRINSSITSGQFVVKEAVQSNKLSKASKKIKSGVKKDVAKFMAELDAEEEQGQEKVSTAPLSGKREGRKTQLFTFASLDERPGSMGGPALRSAAAAPTTAPTTPTPSPSKSRTSQFQLPGALVGMGPRSTFQPEAPASAPEADGVFTRMQKRASKVMFGITAGGGAAALSASMPAMKPRQSRIAQNGKTPRITMLRSEVAARSHGRSGAATAPATLPNIDSTTISATQWSAPTDKRAQVLQEQAGPGKGAKKSW